MVLALISLGRTQNRFSRHDFDRTDTLEFIVLRIFVTIDYHIWILVCHITINDMYKPFVTLNEGCVVFC